MIVPRLLTRNRGYIIMSPDLTREAFLLPMCTNYKLISAAFASLLCLSPVFMINQESLRLASQSAIVEAGQASSTLEEMGDIYPIGGTPINRDEPALIVEVATTMNVVVTAYSSTVEECDSTPFITARGTLVRDGIVANNLLPFGTKIRMPELYGDKIFTVEDRMNASKGGNRFDIWFPSRDSAKNFGVKNTYIEIVEN